MADLSITVASVVPGTTYGSLTAIAGASILQGQSVYLDVTTSPFLLKLAVCNGTVAQGVLAGVSLDAALTGQPCVYVTSGFYTVGATLVKGAGYYLSGTAAGGIAPVADLTTGWVVSLLGFAYSTTVLQLSILNTGITHA